MLNGVCFNVQLAGTARYAGLLLALAKGFPLPPSLFVTFGEEKKPFFALLAHFRPFSNKNSKFEENH